MSRSHQIMTNINARFLRIANRFHRDQRGTSLTEFVICLPIFILIFVGVVNLNKLQDKSMYIKLQATNRLWTNAIPVQKSKVNLHMLPVAGGGKATAEIASHIKDPLSDTIGMASTVGLAATGHFGESYALVKPIDMMADVFTSSMNLEMRGDPVYNGQELARDLLDDGLIKSLPSGSGPLAAFNAFITASGARPAIAAGIRYGLAAGHADADVTFAGQSYQLSTVYDVLVAPKPTSEMVTTAVTRLAVESHKPFSGVLGIAWSNGL